MDNKVQDNNNSNNNVNEDNKEWYKIEEKSNLFLLKLTLYLVIILPRFITKTILVCITYIYYIFSKKEKNYIKQYRENLRNYFGDKIENKLIKTNVFSNFYSFALSIVDKISVWVNKIKLSDLEFVDRDKLAKSVFEKYNDKGRVLLVSHFGNVEVLRALSRYREKIKIVILVYTKNSQVFNDFINKVSKTDLPTFIVEDLGVEEMLKLKELVNSGYNIGIMADRVSINDKKNIKTKFLGVDCYLPTGSYTIAKLLECPVSAIWCERKNNKYLIDIDHIAEKIEVDRKNKVESLKVYVDKYVECLEKHVLNNHTEWFNFYDFWRK